MTTPIEDRLKSLAEDIRDGKYSGSKSLAVLLFEAEETLRGFRAIITDSATGKYAKAMRRSYLLGCAASFLVGANVAGLFFVLFLWRATP